MGYQKPHFSKYPKQEIQVRSIYDIKHDIGKRLSSTHYVLSTSKEVDMTFADKRHHKFMVKVPEGGLKDFQLPTQPHEDIFSLYFTVPLKVAEEQKKKEEQERKIAEQERKKAEESRRKAAKKPQGPVSIAPIPRDNLPENQLMQILDK